ncbi:hypothetical protein BKA70DRAFT_1269421 [Coprinopsis sp. MPI-PUGE-AT-0042]|nr:hypothetical protein BKA70DRAFT_1269421 [Coprinopsis sp. MPI-PUGE-AT-0042]
MVVLAASICTKGGKPVISRQFRDMTRTRMNLYWHRSPKLIPTNTQHTSVETADVRYVYQPLEDLYILLITNKASNILQDIDTLHLFARLVSDTCRSADEREILKNAFELLGAFDEVVSSGYRENVSLTQVKSILEMESHEEKIQEIISRKQKRRSLSRKRTRELEQQRREQQRRGGAAGGGGSYMGGMGGWSPEPASSSRPTKKQNDLLDALGPEAAYVPELSVPSTPGPAISEQPKAPPPQVGDGRGSVPEVHQESVHVVIKETLSLSLLRDGGVQSMELKGDMNLLVTDPDHAHIRLTLSPPTDFGGNGIQFKQHPNVSKFAPNQPRVIALKDPSKAFPVGQNLAVLKWRYAGTDESNVPLSINCWPTPSNDGTCEVSIEYELENQSVTLYDVVISIPLPDGSYPSVSSHSGDWALDADSHSLAWKIPVVSSDDDDTKSGSLIFTCNGCRSCFVGQGSLAGIAVSDLQKIGEGEAPAYSVDALVSTEEYLVI